MYRSARAIAMERERAFIEKSARAVMCIIGKERIERKEGARANWRPQAGGGESELSVRRADRRTGSLRLSLSLAPDVLAASIRTIRFSLSLSDYKYVSLVCSYSLARSSPLYLSRCTLAAAAGAISGAKRSNI